MSKKLGDRFVNLITGREEIVIAISKDGNVATTEYQEFDSITKKLKKSGGFDVIES